jgi:gamma-glutamylputrescine oxidase
MKLSLTPQDQVFWYVNKQDINPLTHDMVTDVVVIGGGMAGLSAAQSFSQKGCNVILLEKNYCGSGASGKSSGFITPNAELSLSDLTDKYGLKEAKRLWEFTNSGVSRIRKNIVEFGLDCDYQIQDTLVVANSTRKYKSMIQSEYDVRTQAGYESALYSSTDIFEAMTGEDYCGGIAYGDTFGIHAFQYCQGMKEVLIDQGVQIFEESPVVSIQNNEVTTPIARVKTQTIVVCIDRFADALPALWDKVYHAQTNILLSAPLSESQIKSIFPHQLYMVWDTDLVYNYFRITGDNRLILGGASIFDTYAPQEKHHNLRTVNKLKNYFAKKFPEANVQFEYVWPGLIGISKDLFPIAGYDEQMPCVYYITAATGLHWGSALGHYCAQRIIDGYTDYDHYFSPSRPFPLGSFANRILGTRATFALSNFFTVGSL